LPQKEEETQWFSVIPTELYIKVKTTIVNMMVSGKMFTQLALTLMAFITENLGFKDTLRVVKHNYSLALLMAARNDLNKRNFNTEALDKIIADVEGFLNVNEKKEENT